MTKSRHNCWIWNLGLTYSLGIGGVINPTDLVLFDTFYKNSVLAQIVPDQTLGVENSVINPNADIKGTLSDQIEGGAIRGTNLFHSFDEFNVREGQGAYFINPAGIEHILSRVTGNSISQIFGKLGVLGNADLFLINPNGIVFGSNATLDLNGSFLATTANSLIFEDGTQFSAVDSSAPPLLTISIPTGLQFGETAGSIFNQSQAVLKDNEGNIFGLGLGVQPEKTLALVGGNVTMKGGSISAPRAHIEIGSVGTGQVRLQETDSDWALSYEDIQSFQDIELTQSPTVSINELLLEGISILSIISPDGRGGGSIQVQGRNITLTNGSQIAGSGANLTLSASETVQVSGTASGIPSAIASEAPLTGTEGSVTINTRKLIVRDGGLLTSDANGFLRGDRLTTTTVPGGNLIVNASESLELKGNAESLTGLFSTTRGFGTAGNITIDTEKLIVSDGATISAESAGEDLLGQPIATGQAGNINIIASEFLELNNGSISSETKGFGGDAGNLTIKTGQMTVFDEAEVTVSNPQGQAGNLTINANSLSLNQGTITAETGNNNGETGANITLEISDLLTLENESQISATANGLADGGNIDIDAGFVIAFPNQNNDIIARAAQGNGGNIEIATNAIFGIAERSSTPVNNTNDIDPSSEFGLDGTVNINELEVNPAEALEELSAEVIDVAGLVEETLCQQAKGSEFIVTGKGGIAPSPVQTRDGEISEVDLVEPALFSAAEGRGARLLAPKEAEKKIIEAQGWIINARGMVELVAHKTDVNGSPAQPKNAKTCNANITTETK